MRPSAFTDGNAAQAQASSAEPVTASMRPSAFTDGNIDESALTEELRALLQ